jgi:hypothetical protein
MSRPLLWKKGEQADPSTYGARQAQWAEVGGGNQVVLRTFWVDTQEVDVEFGLGAVDAAKLGLELLRAAMEKGWRP